MSNAVELVKALVSPANKLIDAVTGAIGRAYQPRHIRKLADAKAYEIGVIGQSIRENADILISYEKGEIAEKMTDYEEFVKRTQSRLAYQELLKQQNIENVADKAYGLLEGETECSPEPVNSDWMTKFFNSVAAVSDEDMQMLWAKILAGEIKKPTSYSLRTLETLKNMSRHEAILFQEVCQYRIANKNDSFLPNDEGFLKQHSIRYESILLLQECGVLNAAGLIVKKIHVDSTESPKIFNGHLCLLAKSKKDRELRISIPIFPFTSIGQELATMLGLHMEDLEFIKYSKDLQLSNQNIEFRVLRFTPISENQVQVYGEDLLLTN